MNKRLNFTQEQVTKILEEIASEKDGYNKVLKYSIEALMRAERTIHNQTNGDVSNGYRWRRAFGTRKQLQLEVPRSRNNNFYPFLLAVIKDQEQELKELAFSLYGSGLTTEQVGDIFKEIYGKKYSTTQVSRLFDYAREEVKDWLLRPLESYYPAIFIDAVLIPTRRVDHVSKEAYYTILGVKADRTREVLAIVNFPQESATAWATVFQTLKQRGVSQIDLVISDGLPSIEDSVVSVFGRTNHQLCVVHLQRNVLKSIKKRDKAVVIEDLKNVFRTNDSSDTPEKGWNRWIKFIDTYKDKYPFLNRMKTQRYRLYFTYMKYDYRIRGMLYTTNWIERLNRDYRRTTRMRGALPNPDATLLLLGYVAMNRKAYQRKIPKLNYEKSFKWED
jgi:transposase-like protein